MIEATCKTCGRTYVVKPYEIGRTRYCSLNCRNIGYATDRTAAQRRLHGGSLSPNANGCRLWKTAGKSGYGQIRVEGRQIGTHVLAYALATNTPLEELRGGRVQIGHLCDRFYAPGDITYRRCVEPSHLVLDTPAGNNLHTHATGRRPKAVDYKWKRGSDHYRAKLTQQDVLQIRAAVAGGASIESQAPLYHVSSQTIWRAVHRLSWKHV